MISTLTLDFTGQRVLVTGAGGGIGAAIAAAFAGLGAEVTGTDLEGAPGIEICDAADEAAMADLVARVDPRHVIHAAGRLFVAPVTATDAGALRAVLESNLVSAFVVARAVASRLPKGGTLTFISSQAGLKGGALWSAYAAAKAGVNRLVDGLAEELGPRGVRVNAICPGGVETPAAGGAIDALAALRGKPAAAIRARYHTNIPLGRFATPEEVAGLCVFLASPLASYVHGAALVADGGELTR